MVLNAYYYRNHNIDQYIKNRTKKKKNVNFHVSDVHQPESRELRPNQELVIVPASQSPTSAVVAIADRSTNRSVILRQRSLSLDNETPLKKSTALFQRLRAGCSKLIRSTPVELYGGGGIGHPQNVLATGPEQPRKATCAATGFMATAPVELKGIMSELRRSSDVVRAILWNLSFRDTYSSGNVSDIDSNDLDVDTLFDRHEQRRYADYEMENGGQLQLLDSLSSLQSFQSLSSAGSLTVAGSCSVTGSTAPEPSAVAPAVFKLQLQTSPPMQPPPPPLSSPPPPPPLPLKRPPPPPTLPLLATQHAPPLQPESSSLPSMDNDDYPTFMPKMIFKIKSSLSLDRINEIADVYNKRYLMTLPPLFLAVVRQNPTIIYLLLKHSASPNIQVSR